MVGIVRDKEYLITRGKPGSRILYFTANPNGEAEIIKVYFKPKPKMKILSMDFDFGQVSIKGRNTQGRMLTHKAVRKVVKGEEGVSTLGAIDVWYDDTVRRLNYDGRGDYLGAFAGDDKIITVQQSGVYRINGFDLSAHFEEDMIRIRKFEPEEILSVVYIEGETQAPYLKRFQAEVSVKKINFIGDDPKARLVLVSFDPAPQLEISFMPNPRRKTEREIIQVAEFIAVKSNKARGKRITTFPCESFRFLETESPEPAPEPATEENARESRPNDEVVQDESVNERDPVDETRDQVISDELQRSDLEKDELKEMKERRKEEEPRQMELDF
ncbi:MAG TPA: hypothetical protein PKH94_01670 [Bacteroidales bacterium]|nr:hypothetical protein [Bacteroidales bacterium]